MSRKGVLESLWDASAVDLSLESERIPASGDPKEELFEGFDNGLDLGDPLVDFRQEFEFKKLSAKVDALAQDSRERAELHGIRKSHARLLFSLVGFWIVIVWVMIAAQAIGHVPFTTSDGLRVPFELSETVIIAFITSTTASVLGLYGIAAYWLFGKPKQPAPKNGKNGNGAKK